MDDWIVKLRQFQRRTGIRDPKLDAQLKGYLEGAASFGRLWFDKPEVTGTVSSEEFRSNMTAEKVQGWWKSALDASLERQDREWNPCSRLPIAVDVVHSIHHGISAHLNVALWGDDFQYGTSFRERLLQYWGKLLFCVRRLW